MATEPSSSNGPTSDADPSPPLFGYDPATLIPPDLLSTIPETERSAALGAAAAARRAEERAEARALERALERKRLEREEERRREEAEGAGREGGVGGGARKRPLGAGTAAGGGGGGGDAGNNGGGLVFMSKKKRAELARERAHPSPAGSSSNDRQTKRAAGTTNGNHGSSNASSRRSGASSSSAAVSSSQSHLTPAQIASIKKSYLGESALMDEADERRKLEADRRRRKQKKITFKFEWDASEDTAAADDLLYGGGAGAQNGRGQNRGGGSRGGHHHGQQARRGGPPSGPRRGGGHRTAAGRHDPLSRDDVATTFTVATKPLEKMTARDWRIFRENYNIVVKGGKAPSPLRSFRETPLGIKPVHPALIDAIENTLRYKEPSPIQRQAIPIGMQRRDLIGVAETGSGKTAAFGIPLCHHILSLPPDIHDTVAEKGPLALVMAPTRELALQIDAEIEKLLSRQRNIATLAVVGGQPIQQQATRLREGVHVVVGTPGRLNDCIEMAYLVLNQCSYVVLDEADRMIDLGFAPQIEQILDAMGGLLKSEDETEAYRQERSDLEKLGKVVPSHRLTAMFSATMPPEVERIAKRYLRHPAIVSIGDEKSGKNARITQRVMFLSSPSQKERTLRDILGRCRADDKVIVFVNEKKHADGVGRTVEKSGRRCVVLHGGKTQDQREENLGLFRRGGGVVLVATDVAGRGLDIADVTQVINYDLPSRSIDNYCHRIGRTGRAGKEGIATSFLTDEDEGIMAPLKAYLESTGMAVPDRLARHPAAVSGVPGGNIQ